MKLRTLASAAAVGAGAVVGLNGRLRADEPPEPPLPGDRETFRWRGMDVAYTEAGDPDDPTLVLFHGVNAAGSAGEWREVFGDLTADHHVVAPDLPGYGRSDRPALRYSAALYEDFVRDFLARYDAPRVVASSLSAAYVVAGATPAGGTDDAAAGVPVSGLLLVCPTTTAGPSPPKPWLRELIRSPVAGEALFNLITSKPAIRYFNADHAYADPANATAEWTDFEWRTSHVPGARYAAASFVSGYLNSEVDLGAELAELAAAGVPTTIVWGREADVSPLSDGRDLAEDSDARLVVFDRAKLLPHVEFPNQFLDAAREAFAEA
ncbi:alpha/beta fold hydrolase [Haloparvum alkalitolerans]|uniref:alpha/beta fold hydrolase n=1 Tax=Haloparvum alkalitolerans TaxID=1042953 RepID=UPI003CED3C14